MLFDLKQFGDDTALIMEDSVMSYAELYEASERIAKAIGHRSLLFLVCRNRPASIAGYMGCVNHGIVTAMIDDTLDSELLAHLVELYRPEYFWLPEDECGKYPNYNEVMRFQDYVLLSTGEKQPFPLYEELGVLITTSGSTGSPKLVRQSYKNIRANTESIIEYLHIDSKERAITNLPMHYVYGLSVIHTHLYAGAALVVTEKSMFERAFWDVFREKAATSFAGVPYTYEMLNKLKFFNMELPSLRYMTQAGGKLAPELHKKFAEYAERDGKSFVVMYGAAEATARMGYLPPKESLRKWGCMGMAIPGGRFELWDENDHLIKETGVVGELVYYGDNIMLGYAEKGEDLSLGDINKGCLHTGDMAKVDDEGYYTVVGRKKRFLKLFGRRTNLEEAEQLLKIKFDTVAVACAGVDDKMYIFTTDEALYGKLAPYLAEKLATHHSAFREKLIPKIPKNSSGKTIYKELEPFYDEV